MTTQSKGSNLPLGYGSLRESELVKLTLLHEMDELVIMTPATGLLARVFTEKGTLLSVNRQFQKEGMGLTWGCALDPDEGRL